jgi:sec-independent protein translocase protein TatB
MFDVGFTELALIFAVSLLVLGPKKLPGLVKKVGRWVGKARSMARDFQQQLENEVNLEELNNITNQVAREAQNTAPPPDFTSEPLAPETSTYPYSAQDSSTEGASSMDAPSTDSHTTDDTYSHAHAAGDVPVQTDLDLSDPDDPHLPHDDTRRNT